MLRTSCWGRISLYQLAWSAPSAFETTTVERVPPCSKRPPAAARPQWPCPILALGSSRRSGELRRMQGSLYRFISNIQRGITWVTDGFLRLGGRGVWRFLILPPKDPSPRTPQPVRRLQRHDPQQLVPKQTVPASPTFLLSEIDAGVRMGLRFACPLSVARCGRGSVCAGGGRRR